MGRQRRKIFLPPVELCSKLCVSVFTDGAVRAMEVGTRSTAPSQIVTVQVLNPPCRDSISRPASEPVFFVPDLALSRVCHKNATALSRFYLLMTHPIIVAAQYPHRAPWSGITQEIALAADRLSYHSIAIRAPEWLQAGAASLAEPANSRRLRRALVLLLALWILSALAQLIWALFPQAGSQPPAGHIINPPVLSAGSAASDPVDIDALRGWPLFGEPGTAVTAEPEAELAAASAEREGIEQDATETRLDLVLRGIIALNADGTGSAIIEHRGRQEVYAVDDTLPVSARVTLAKVMPSQVVLDNGGTYELLRLYQPSALDAQLTGARPAPVAGSGSSQSISAPVQVVDKRDDADATALAQGYREQLYQDPQSLAELVRIAAVRDGGELQGYRLTPGRDREQFEQLGFRSGDLVVAVNGMPLSDPANTMRLYQAMRSANEASFELLRGGEAVAVNVSLGAAAGEQ